MTEQGIDFELLFAPKSTRGLRVDYPELSEYEEFKALRQYELLFVWYFACKSSPLFDKECKERELIIRCVEITNLKIDDPAKKEKFFSGNFPEKIQTAIKTMNTFEPAARIQAKLLAMKQLKDIKKLTSLVLDEKGNHEQFMNKDGEVDFTKKNQYQAMIMNSNAKLGDMVAKAERGFGVSNKQKRTIDKNREDSGHTFAESFHDK